MNRIYSVTLAGVFIATAGVVFFQKLGSEKTALSNRSSSSGSAYEQNSRLSEIRPAKSSQRIIKRSKPKGLSDYLLKNPSEINSLTAEQAAELVVAFANDRGLKLPGLTSIDKNVARELAKYEGIWLQLTSLTSIDKDVAYELAKYEGRLNLAGLTSIDQDTTRELAKYEGDWLKLSGLTSIDQDVAYELAKWGETGAQLYLEGLTSIDKGVAYELAKYDGSIVLGLSSIDNDVAEELAKKDGGQLHLWGLVSIDKDVAQALSRFGGTYLSLKGVELIDKDVARELSNSDVSWLDLTGLTSIDSDVAQEMAQFQGQLSFSNLSSIDREAAEKLANYTGYAGRRMYINGGTNGGANLDPDPQILEILNSNPAIQLPSKYRMTENGAIMKPEARAGVNCASSG